MSTAPRRPNLILITVDCLRRDRLSAYGYERPTTPFLDWLLDTSLHCTSAHSTSSWTCPSIASILTGLHPHHHGGGVVPGDPKNLSKHNLPTALPREIPALPDLLASKGYASAAIGAVWNAHLSIPDRFPEMTMMEKPAPKLLKRALQWIRAQDDPFFLWLHLGDTHEPLDVPRPLWNVFGEVPRLRKIRRWDFTGSGDAVGSQAFLRYRDARVRLYDAAVRSVDETLRDLWTALGSLGKLDRTLIVVTSDHGEELWEHRDEEMADFSDPRDIYGTGHGHNLFQVHLLVPLIFNGPGVSAGRVDENVSLTDVVPTVLQAMSVDEPLTDGRSLFGTVEARPVLAQGIAYGHEKKSVVVGDLKLLSSPGDGYERLFRLGADRRETAVMVDPAEAERLRRLLPGEPSALGEQVEATDEILEHLRGLGYIE